MPRPGDTRAETVDCGLLYDRKRHELVEVLRAQRASDLERRIPATPAWRVRDALAHVVGIAADLNRGNFGIEDPEAWTASQVDRRRADSIGDMAAEWDREAPTFEEGLRLLGYGVGSHYVGDLHAHLQDVRQALGLDPDHDELAVAVSLDFYLTSFHEALCRAGAGSVEVSAGSETTIVGEGPVHAAVDAAPFELLRCLSGRRSVRQVRALAWTGDVDAVLGLVSRYPMPVDDLFD